jgi:5-enolpyruvylshikimate-3-phosphate synthase
MHLEASGGDSDDVLATKAVLSAMDKAVHSSDSQDVILPCNESGSTLRFMIPVAAAFLLGSGRKASGVKRLCFTTKGRLFDRPLDELEAALTPHGISIEKDSETRTIIVSGEMYPGTYTIDGGVSSQYISGLIMALTLFREKCEINVTGDIKSIHYIELTEDVLKKYGCAPEKSGNKYYPINNGYRTVDGELLIDPNAPFTVEGDWSNGAFLLCLKEFTDIEISNLNYESRQGDKAILDFLDRVHTIQSKIKNKPTDDCTGYIHDYSDIPDTYILDCTDIPDITPYMAVVAAFTFEKAVFTGISRLRIKESDRVMAVREQLEAVGIKTEETEDSLTVYGNVALPSSYKKDSSSNVNPLKLSSYHDHRMAMCAILISVILDAPVELDDIQCLNKSFPQLLEYLNISD